MNRVSIKVISTFTVEPLSPYLTWWFDQQNIEPAISVAPYHNVFQELISESEGADTHFCYCIRFEDYIRGSKKAPSEQITILSQTFDSLCSLFSNKKFAATSFVVLMPVRENVFQPIVEKHLRVLYERWFAVLSDMQEQGVIAVDLREIATQYDVNVVFDNKRDELGHIPYSEKFFCASGSVIAKKILAVYQRPFKVIVVDADNTLWEGLCGEEAANRLRITDAHQTFHRFLIGKVKTGYLLALVSKNNEDDVFNVFDSNERLLLKRDHFVSFKINWNRKSDNIRAIARDLNLASDCFCFLDDSPTECSEVNTALPDVLAIQMPPENQIPDFLDRLWFFDKFSVTDEDRVRTASYRAEIKRAGLRQEVTFEEFLKQIDIRIWFRELHVSELERASQLTLRTNQFNSSGKRRNVSELGLLLKAGYVIWSVNVSDLYGDYGFSGLVIGVFENNTLRIDTFLLSCRVLGKEIECSILYALKQECIARGIDTVLIDFYPSQKNQPFSAFLHKRADIQVSEKDGCAQCSIATADISENINHTLSSKLEQSHVSTEQHTIPIFSFHHVAIAVEKIEDARVIFKALNYQSSEPVFDEYQQVMLSMCTKTDDTPVELVAPVNTRSPINHILKKNGEIPYHLCYQVESFDKALQHLTVSAVEYNIVKDAHWAILFDAPVMFIHVKDVGLIELVELGSNATPLLSPSVLIQMVTPNIESLSLFFNAIGYHQDSLVSGSCSYSYKSKYHSGIEVIPEYFTTPEARMFVQNNGAYVFRLKIVRDEPGNIERSPSYMLYTNKNREVRTWRHKWEWSQLLPLNVDLFHKNVYEVLCLTTVDQILNKMKGETTTSVHQIETRISVTGQKLWCIWRDVLKTRDIYTGQTFFELGGHSLLATQILSRIYDEFNVDLSLIEFFDHPTVSEMAQLIDNKANLETGNRASNISPVDMQETYSLSNAQKRIWFLHQASEDTSFNNMIRAYRMKGPLDYQTLDAAFSLLIQRHESLRTVFVLKHDEPRQQILNAEEIGFSVQYFDYAGLENKFSLAAQLQRLTWKKGRCSWSGLSG
jgi:FkbH-like protein